jgi:hypothetical protein
MRVPFGCGRPIWVDDDDVDVTRHVRAAGLPSAADREALACPRDGRGDAAAPDGRAAVVDRGHAIWRTARLR